MKRLHAFQSKSQGEPSYVFELDHSSIAFGQDTFDGVYDRASVALCDVDAFIVALREARDAAYLERVNEWHLTETDTPLHEWLGMSQEQYAAWVERRQDGTG